MQHVVFASLNVEAFRSFYCDKLGFSLTDRVLHDDGSLATCFFTSNHEHHTLACFLADRQGIDHHCYEAGEWNYIRDWCDHFADQDIPLVWGPGRHGPGNNLFAFVNDPDGNWVEVSAELETVRTNPPVAPVAAVDPRAPGFAPGPLEPPSEPKASLLSFSNDKPGTAKAKATESAPALLLEASRDYLPPNSYAPATVIVGVDASTGVTSQSDPLPVVLRITGPARSVLQGNKLLTTDLTGCLVNGAARGDLSAEKVYVKLVRMTCAQPGGRFAVSEVKGFIAFAGKSGVRGNVVSREGSLVSQALLAGIVGGFGRGFSANANGIFAGQVGSDGKREALSPTDILAGGFGQGAGEAADTVSKYLIERAEQYQPVVEMPTGIAVEIVFLDGVHVRSTPQ